MLDECPKCPMKTYKNLNLFVGRYSLFGDLPSCVHQNNTRLFKSKDQLSLSIETPIELDKGQHSLVI